MARLAVFAVHDSTTYRNLKPIAEAVSESIDVEYLLLDELFGESGVPAEELVPYKRASHFTRGKWVNAINQRTRPGPLPVAALQRILDDQISPSVSFKLKKYLRTTDPDLFICGHDRLPFIKHIIKRSHNQDIHTSVVQHGIQRLEHVRSDSWLLNMVRPTGNPVHPRVERIKRRLFYGYGAYIFCNPFVDSIYTIGDFFTEQIKKHRSEYPCFGNADIRTTGYPEYGLKRIVPYDSTIETALFLSGWEYEAGEWGNETEQLIKTRLRGIQESNGISVVVRPHPKDSENKIKRFYGDFTISEQTDLQADIRDHDLILSVYSTAMLLAAAEGKPCGVLKLPWEQNRFGPFEHEHIIDITSAEVDVSEEAVQRSHATQRRYLRNYCYIPAAQDGPVRDTPTEYIASLLGSVPGHD